MNGKTILSGVAVLVINLNAIGCTNVISAPGADAFFNSAVIMQDEQDYPVRKETRQTLRLTPNATVAVKDIEGSVEVETTDDGTGELVFIREAKTQTDFDCETIVVQQSPDKLIIQRQRKGEKQCSVVRARERLKLTIPRTANLSFEDIEGSFTAGATEGFLQLRNIEGGVRIAQAKAAEISSVESDVSVNVSEINSPGININNIEGAVEIGVRKDLNASLKIDASDVRIDISNTSQSSSGRKSYNLQLGSGGESISISNIEGGVKVHGI